MPEQSFITTSRGLKRDYFPMRLFERAKRMGVWNPSDIDFSQDVQHWQLFNDEEQDLFLRMAVLFQAGEEAVTLDLLPLMRVIAQEGRLEEELFLTTFLYDEARHIDFFSRFLKEVPHPCDDLSHYHSSNFRILFCEVLPQALRRLLDDPSPANQARAVVTYNIIVEGVVAETGYHASLTTLERRGLMPGYRKGITFLKQDESRHIAYGVFLLSRLVALDHSLWLVIEETMNTLLALALGIMKDIFTCYKHMPFELVEDDLIDFAVQQFQKRLDRIKQARGASLEEIYHVTE